jgi:hypothetical protein
MEGGVKLEAVFFSPRIARDQELESSVGRWTLMRIFLG